MEFLLLSHRRSFSQKMSPAARWEEKRLFSQATWRGIRRRTSGTSLSPLGAQNNDLGAALQALLRRVRLRLIQRNLWNCPKNVEEIAYTSRGGTKLEYASAAWDPSLKKDISALERVQRKAARFCSQNYYRYASVTDMIKDLGWATLETRRRLSRLTLTVFMRISAQPRISAHLK